jgi:hypothetical protein
MDTMNRFSERAVLLSPPRHSRGWNDYRNRTGRYEENDEREEERIVKNDHGKRNKRNRGEPRR